MPTLSDVVDMTGDSDEDVTEIIDVLDDSEGEDKLPIPLSVPPRKFHGYRRGRELGRGATGKVFVCNRKDSEKSFAVKVVDLRRMLLSSHVQNVHTSLCREVGILKSLSPHPNIVQMVDAFEEGNWFLIILELVGGGDLFTVLTSRDPARFLEREAAFVQKQLVEGLTFLHGQCIIHRDLKLENILVDSECREPPLVFYSVKITDFGLSKAIGAGRSEAKSMVGTRPYTAPEVLRGGTYDFSSDLWCLGVLLHVLLAGQFPFDHTPAQQCEADDCIARFEGGQAAKSMLSGLLQLEPARRLSLEGISGHDWLQEGGAREAPERTTSQRQGAEAKRQRKLVSLISSDVGRMAHDPTCPELRMTNVPVAADAPNEAGLAVLPVAPNVQEGGAAPSKEPVEPPAMPLLLPPAVESPRSAAPWAQLEPTDVCPPSSHPDVMQIHTVVPGRLAEAILGRKGVQARQIAATVGCQLQVRTLCDEQASDHRVIIVGNCNQCVLVQELLQGRLAEALRAEGQGAGADCMELLMFIRAEAAGVVIGKQGFVLRQIRRQSGAGIQLLREEVKGQRPCILTGALQSVIRAEKHVFDLVRAVPVAAPAQKKSRKKNEPGGPHLPRSRVSKEPLDGEVVSWKGQVGWIRPLKPISHPQAAARQGHIYVHDKDIVNGGPLAPGQLVRFHVYSDTSGLGAEECFLR